MRSKAVENAKARAVALTKPLNQTVGAAINIVDNVSDVINYKSGELNEVVVTGYARVKQAGIDPPSIDFEKIKVVANVNVKFVLK